jgi:recombination associated protein RdgC
VFKNVIVYRMGANWAATLEQIERGVDGARFVACGASQERSVGWIEPRGQAHGPLLETVDGQIILKLKIESRSVPASVIKRKTQERVDQIEVTTGRKPGKKEIRDIKDDIKLELLPLAFTKENSIWIWINRKAQWLMIDAGSQSKADDVATLLVKSLPGLTLVLINTVMSPATAMAQWLITQEAPGRFGIDRECELKAADESRAVVRYARHPLDTDEVRAYVKSGKLPTRLALTWDGRVSFVLTQALELKKLAFLDVVFEGVQAGKDDSFDANVAIATGELCKLLPDLLEALGGEGPVV